MSRRSRFAFVKESNPESPAYAAKRLRRGRAVARTDCQRAEAGESRSLRNPQLTRA